MLEKHLTRNQYLLSDITFDHASLFENLANNQNEALYFTFLKDAPWIADALVPKAYRGLCNQSWMFFFDVNGVYVGTWKFTLSQDMDGNIPGYREIVQKAMLLNAFYVCIVSERNMFGFAKSTSDRIWKDNDEEANANKLPTSHEFNFTIKLRELLKMADVEFWDHQILTSPTTCTSGFLDDLPPDA